MAYACWLAVTFAVGSVHASDKDAIQSAFLSRINKLSNASIESVTRLFNTEQSNPKKTVADSGWYRFRLSHLDGSYRMEYIWYSSQAESKPTTSSTCVFNDSDGIKTVVGTNSAVHGVYARIDREHDSNIGWNRTVELLGIAAGPRDSILAEAIGLSEEWTITKEGEKVVVTYPLPANLTGGEKGIRSIVCDPSRGYCATQITLRIGNDVDKRGMWRIEQIELGRIQEQDGLWFPMEFTETIKASVLPEGTQSNVHTTIEHIGFGNVSADDLVLDIPPGTEVVDTLSGVSYMVGKDKNREQVKALAEESPINVIEDSDSGSWRSYTFSATVFVVVLLSVLTILKRLRREV